jgi:hypothetical protein
MTQEPIGVAIVELPGIAYGGADYPIHLDFEPGELAAGDRFHIDWRTEFGGDEVGTTSSDDEGDVLLDVPINRATLFLRHAKTATWFAKELREQTIDETNRVVDLSGTYVHTDAQGRTKGASGLLEFHLKFRVGLTRD